MNAEDITKIKQHLAGHDEYVIKRKSGYYVTSVRYDLDRVYIYRLRGTPNTECDYHWDNEHLLLGSICPICSLGWGKILGFRNS